MGYAVVLTFDEILEKAVHSTWDQLEGFGERLKTLGSMPHITLAAFDDVNPEKLKIATKRFSENASSINIKFSSFGAFATEEHVIFLAPDPTPELLDLQQQFFDMLGPLSRFTSYKPGIWIPHCTIAMHVEEKDYSRALQTCYTLNLPISGLASSVEIVKFMPIEKIARFPLIYKGP